MIKFNEVTWYSKLAAIIFFIGVLPLLTFYLGMKYQETKSVLTSIPAIQTQAVKANENSTDAIAYETKDINGFKMPQITAYHDVAVMKKVNDQLTAIANGWGCDAEPEQHASYNIITKVAYAKNDIFSVSIHASYYCGGPYPTNDSNQSVTFDMKTGDKVALEDMFDNFKRDKKAIVAIVFSDLIKRTNDESNGSCKGTYSLDNVNSGREVFDFSEFLTGLVEGDGITIQPEFAHVVEVCSQEAHASAAQLSAFYGSSSILARVK